MNSDIFAFESSSKNSSNFSIENPVEKKFVSEIQDSNTGNYNSNIIKYDLSSLYNQNLFVDWNSPNSYLAIPIVTHLSLRTTAGNVTTGAHVFIDNKNNYALGYKNGSYQLIDSVSLKCGNNQLSSGNNNLNVLNNFKNLTIYSRESLENADIYNFYPDGHESWSYATIGDAEGTVDNSMLKNNNIVEAPLAAGVLPDFNKGFLQRIKNLNGNIVKEANGLNNNKGSNVIMNSSNDNTLDTVTRVTANDLVYKNVFFIKLKDISDFFNKVGYSRFYCTLEIQMNIGSCDILLNDKGAVINTPLVDTDIVSYTSSFQKATCPFMISKIGQGLNIQTAAAAPVATTLKIQNGICKVGNYSSNLPNTTLYAQTVQLKPKFEESLLSTKKKQIVYEDFYQSDTKVDFKASINYIATNGIANLKYVVVIPFINSVNNLNLSPLLSPFTSEPGTSSPCINISNIQLLLAGERVLPTEVKYNSRNFLENLYGCRSINGGRTEELSSGLINYQMFLNNYRYYYFDVSHLNNSTPRAVTFVGKNDTNVAIQLFIFCVYSKVVNVDIQSGELSVE
jgi:hypothetical protein